MSKLIKYFIVFLLGTIVGVVSYQTCCKKQFDDTITTIRRDTVIFRDTIRTEKPIEKHVAVTDTLYLPIRDTITLRDTTYIMLEKLSKTYSDSTYTLQVSGYQPTLDWIEVYPTRVVVTEKLSRIIIRNFVVV